METYDGDINIEPFDDGDDSNVKIEGTEESPTIIEGESGDECKIEGVEEDNVKIEGIEKDAPTIEVEENTYKVVGGENVDSNSTQTKLEANQTYQIEGVRMETDDNGVVYKKDGKFLPNSEYTLNENTYKTNEVGERYPQSPEGYLRPSLRKEVEEEIYSNAPVDSEGRYLDANTGLPIEGKPDIGHKPGHEHRREQQRAFEEKLSVSEFNDKMNNPELYQLEDAKNNRSHKFEDKSPVK